MCNTISEISMIVDLSMTIADHLRWSVDRRLKGDFADGNPFQVTYVGWAVHGFTHVDAPRHMVPDGPTTSDLSLDKIVGSAAVVDLTGIAPESEISAEQLQVAGAHIQHNDIVVMKTAWDTVESPQTAEFWTRAPYMSREAAQWLLSKQIRAIAFDFPQDYPIRKLLVDQVDPITEFVTHDVLLRNNVTLIEYICNTASITKDRVDFYALPLKILDSDGAPARVIAIQ
jgi:arylformamidase